MNDTILCTNKEEAKRYIEIISEHIDDWEFLEDGKVLLKLDCEMGDLKGL